MNIKALSQTLSCGEGFLICSGENRRYLTGFPSSDGYLLITAEHAVFLTDSRYIEAAQSGVAGCDEISRLRTFDIQLPQYIKKLGITRLYLESERLTVARFRRICKIVSCEISTEKTDREITALRRKKSEEEKQSILKAQAIAEKAFDHILGFISKDKSEKDIALELDYFMLKNGAEAVSFDTIAVSGANSSMPHGVPSSKKIQKGDFLTLDFGAVVDGYHSDMTRTIAFASVNDKMVEVYETVLSAQLAALAELKAGISGYEADNAARDLITFAGYGEFFSHSTGHGVGIEIHEEPRLSPGASQTLQFGDVVTVEPGIYIPSKFGVRIEDMAFITENGYENLTRTPKNLIII